MPDKLLCKNKFLNGLLLLDSNAEGEVDNRNRRSIATNHAKTLTLVEIPCQSLFQWVLLSLNDDEKALECHLSG
jgi:hypothetical protein